MKKIKEFAKLSNTLKSLDKNVDLTFKEYEKKALKYNCYTCKTRGNPIKVPFEKLHDDCKDCKYISEVLPLFNKSIEARNNINTFIISEYFPKAYDYLSNANPLIRGPKGLLAPFLDIFKEPIEQINDRLKEIIVYIIEDGGVYHIVASN